MKAIIRYSILTGLLMLIATSLVLILTAINNTELINSTALFSISCVIALMILKIK